jgi:hypothetical protein
MGTILTKLESILNSRPLVVASKDPEDPSALTPGHFLVGRPLVAVIEPNYSSITSNRLNRWQLLQQMSQNFRRVPYYWHNVVLLNLNTMWWNITTLFILEIWINTSDLLSAKSLRKVEFYKVNVKTMRSANSAFP